jgi:phosphoglycerate dehydrogenase-like enzyme
MPRVCILDDYQDVALRMADWTSLTDVTVECWNDHLADENELARRLQDVDIVVAMRERSAFPASLLRRLPALRLLVTTGRSNAAIDLHAATELGITVCGTGGTLPPTVELTWALILGLARHTAEENAALRTGRWQTTLGRQLSGTTLGVLGLGHIGSGVAAIGAAFGMDVIAWSENLTEERARSRGARLVGRDELFATSDVLTVHVVLSDRTRGLIGEPELRAMKDDALLINTSRAPIVAEDALVRALHEGWIGGAGLDVFDPEPLPLDSPLLSAPHTLLTPHLGYVADECYRVFFGDAVEDIAAFLAGAPIRRVRPAPR